MRFDDDVWYARWFFWSVGIRDAFRPYHWQKREEEIKEDGKTNFCFFFRTMTFTAPLILLLHAAVYGLAVWSLTWVPVHVFGSKAYFSVLGACALIMLIIFGLKKLPKSSQRQVQRRQSAPAPRRIQPATAVAVPNRPSFRKVVAEWLEALDKKICPTVEFSKKQGVR